MKRNVHTKMRIRRSLINRASSLFLKTRHASSTVEKCAREYITEVVLLSSWSLKKSRAPMPLARNALRTWRNLSGATGEGEEIFVNGREVKSFAWHVLSLFPRGLITLIASAVGSIAGTRVENFIQKRCASAGGFVARGRSLREIWDNGITNVRGIPRVKSILEGKNGEIEKSIKQITQREAHRITAS